MVQRAGPGRRRCEVRCRASVYPRVLLEMYLKVMRTTCKRAPLPPREGPERGWWGEGGYAGLNVTS